MPSSHRTALLLLIALAELSAVPLVAQIPRPSRISRAPGSVALAFGVGGSGAGLTADALLGYRSGRHEIAARGVVGLRIGIFQKRSESLSEAGLLYGLHPLSNPRVLAIRAGLSGVWYSVERDTPKSRKDYDPVLGVPLEVALTLPIGSHLGLGMSGIANLNSVRRYAGLLLTLTLGR